MKQKKPPQKIDSPASTTGLAKKKVDDDRFTTFYNDGLFAESLPLMNEMRRQGKLCDVTLKVENKNQSFSAHRIILVGGVPYFRTLFTSNMPESQMEQITIKEIEPNALESLINYAYTATIRIDYQNALNLLLGATIFQLIKVRDACAVFLISCFTPHNVLGIRRTAEELHCVLLVQAADQYINSHFAEVTESQEFLLLTSDQLIEFIQRDELEIQTEEIVFVGCMRWVKHKQMERSEVFPVVFSRIRLPMLSPLFLVDHVCNEELVESSPECRKLVDEAKNYHLLPERKHQLQGFRTRPRCEFRQIFMLGHSLIRNDHVTTVDIYDPTTGKQTTNAHTSKDGQVDGVAVVNAKLYVFGHNAKAASTFLQIYDSKHGKWSESSRTNLTRRCMGVAVLSEAIYLCGGEINTDPCNTVERFESKSGEWNTIAPMLENRSGPCAASLDGFVYVLGGDLGESISNSAERYDPARDIWEKVKSMLNKRNNFGTATLNGKLYACGGYDGTAILQSVEIYHPNTDTWNLVAPMNCKRRNFGLVVFVKKLWAIGGYDGEKDLTSVEVYDPETNKWTFAQSMNAPRSCTAAGVLPVL